MREFEKFYQQELDIETILAQLEAVYAASNYEEHLQLAAVALQIEQIYIAQLERKSEKKFRHVKSK